MRPLARACVPAAVAVGTLAALGAIAFVAVAPSGWFDVVLALTALAFVPTALIGAAIVRAQPGNRAGWILLVAGAALPVSMLTQVIADAAFASGADGIPVPEAFALVSAVTALFGVPLVGTFGVLVLPDGRVPAGSRKLAWACLVDLTLLLLWALFSPSLLGTRAHDVPSPIGVAPADALVLAILVLAPLTALTSRTLWRRVRGAEGETRQGLLLAARASVAIPVAFGACVIVGMSGGDTTRVAAVENCAAIAIAVAAWIGVVRYGLFDLRVVLSRSLVYGLLTAAVVAFYAGVSALFADEVAPVLAAVAATLLVLPLRDVLQRAVNRRVFGLRDDPGAALGLLGVRLDAAAAPDDVLPAAARTVGEALRLRYVAIDVGGVALAIWGEQVTGPVGALDLPFAGESIGQLSYQPRDPHEPMSRADRALLDSLARQLGVAAHAVALTGAVRASRERLVTAREEERRRLRRDLHDGLGPTLAGIALGIDAARRSLPPDAPAAELMASLRGEAERAVADIRRIAYDLRPPVLDELGLGPALCEQALRFGGVTVSLPDELPALPAAVEVAAYRIAVEAMTNAARHAPGAQVEVTLSVNGDLELEIADTGTGMPDGYRAGVGITSMRERAVELGGECVLAAHVPHGTIVRARLPL